MGSIELVCPAGTPSMLHAAVEAGADSVYCGLADATNARNFPGLNFSSSELRDAARWCHARGAKILFAANTFARAGETARWEASVDSAVDAGVDAVIVADIGVLAYMRRTHPDVRLHLSVQAAAGTPEAADFYAAEYGVKRVVLPRVLSVPEIADFARRTTVELEAFVFGGLCVMTEGRCALSSWAAGGSPNLTGVCSPPDAVSFTEDSDALTARLGGLAIDRFGAGETAGYPTLCKGRFEAMGETSHLFADPVSLNAIALLEGLRKAGVRAAKIEGRQRGKAYVARVAAAFRQAIDALDSGIAPAMAGAGLADLAEGRRETAGAYRKVWR